MRKIGINVDAIKGFSDAEYIKKISELGFGTTFSGIFDMKRQLEIAEACAKYGVEYESLHAPFDHINDIWFDGEKGDLMLKELVECVERCKMVGAGVAVIHLSSGENAPPITDVGRERFTKLVETAKKTGIKLAFENQRKLSNLAWVFETFTPEDNVGFCWDCGHENCFTLGRKYMPLFGNRLIYVHLHDNFGVYNQDCHLLPFDGNIDFTKVMGALDQVEFTGNITLEVMATNSNLYDNISADEYLSKAAESAKKLLEIQRLIK